jgi:hypothetical protein
MRKRVLRNEEFLILGLVESGRGLRVRKNVQWCGKGED